MNATAIHTHPLTTGFDAIDAAIDLTPNHFVGVMWPVSRLATNMLLALADHAAVVEEHGVLYLESGTQHARNWESCAALILVSQRRLGAQGKRLRAVFIDSLRGLDLGPGVSFDDLVGQVSDFAWRHNGSIGEAFTLFTTCEPTSPAPAGRYDFTHIRSEELA